MSQQVYCLKWSERGMKGRGSNIKVTLLADVGSGWVRDGVGGCYVGEVESVVRWRV